MSHPELDRKRSKSFLIVEQKHVMNKYLNRTCMDKGRQLKWSRKRVLVTGGAGFLGSALVRRLKEMSAEIIVLDDLSTGDRGLVKGLADEFVQDKVTLESLSKITDPDIIFHLGAPSSIILFDKNRDALKDTVGGMKAVLDYCASTHVQKL
ncbi:NAD-dependent epimerase/dehydratase family protein, partial [Candidatus Bathyarchaeota archaeon]